jgi:hypothetical protein
VCVNGGGCVYVCEEGCVCVAATGILIEIEQSD